MPDLSLLLRTKGNVDSLGAAPRRAGKRSAGSFRAPVCLCPRRQVRPGCWACPEAAAEPRPAPRPTSASAPRGGASAAAPTRPGRHKGPAAGRGGAAPPAPGPALPRRSAACSPGRGPRPPRPAPWPPRLLLLHWPRPLPSLRRTRRPHRLHPSQCCRKSNPWPPSDPDSVRLGVRAHATEPRLALRQ